MKKIADWLIGWLDTKYPLLTFYFLWKVDITSEKITFPDKFRLCYVFKGIFWLVNLHTTYHRIYWKNLTSGISNTTVNWSAQNVLQKASCVPRKCVRVTSLKVAPATFLLVVLYFCLRKSTRETSKNVFIFISKIPGSFCSWDNQILNFYLFKFHDVIKCLSMKHETHFIE